MQLGNASPQLLDSALAIYQGERARVERKRFQRRPLRPHALPPDLPPGMVKLRLVKKGT